MNGKLYLCATPIGNLGDITLRCVETLRTVDLIAAEDTRRTLGLLNHLEIEKPLTSYFEHNKKEKGEYLINEIKNGKNIIFTNSAFGILNTEYKYKFCGFPKGVSIPPRFAAIFCIINVNAIYFSFFVVVSTKYPSGRNVKSAISFAISIEPINVIYTSAKTAKRAFLKYCTIFLAII